MIKMEVVKIINVAIISIGAKISSFILKRNVEALHKSSISRQTESILYLKIEFFARTHNRHQIFLLCYALRRANEF